MGFLPKSRKARRRLTAVVVAAPILGVSVALSLFAMGDAAVFFYSPAQARAKHVPAGRLVRLGGLVEMGSVRKLEDGEVRFGVTDRAAADEVVYRGDLPDLFREGQGVVTQGVFRPPGGRLKVRGAKRHGCAPRPPSCGPATVCSGPRQWPLAHRQPTCTLRSCTGRRTGARLDR